MERWERAYANGLLVTWKARTWCSRAAAEFRTACSGTELRIIECRVAIIVEKNHTPPFGGLPKATPYGGGRLLCAISVLSGLSSTPVIGGGNELAVLSVQPQARALAAPVDTAVAITFDKALDRSARAHQTGPVVMLVSAPGYRVNISPE